MAEMTKVWIDEEACIACEACVEAAPDVFEMSDDTCVVKDEAKDADFVKSKAELIKEAVETCPTDAIKFE